MSSLLEPWLTCARKRAAASHEDAIAAIFTESAPCSPRMAFFDNPVSAPYILSFKRQLLMIGTQSAPELLQREPGRLDGPREPVLTLWPADGVEVTSSSLVLRVVVSQSIRHRAAPRPTPTLSTRCHGAPPRLRECRRARDHEGGGRRRVAQDVYTASTANPCARATGPRASPRRCPPSRARRPPSP